MELQTVTLKAKNGLHIRPAAQLVSKAKSFTSDIEVCVGEQRANAKSLSRLQRLEIIQGSEINIQASGDDEKNAVASLVAFIEELH